MKKQHSYFTLVEILTVIVILMVLTGISLGVAGIVRNKIASARTESAIKMIEIALEQYKTKYGYYPRSSPNAQPFYMDEVNLSATTGAKSLQNNLWQFFDEKFKNSSTKALNTTTSYVIDGYARPLVYRCPGVFNAGSFDLGSGGKDGQYGDAIAGDPELTLGNIGNNAKYDKFGQGDDIVNFTNNAQ